MWLRYGWTGGIFVCWMCEGIERASDRIEGCWREIDRRTGSSNKRPQVYADDLVRKEEALELMQRCDFSCGYRAKVTDLKFNLIAIEGDDLLKTPPALELQ